MARVLTFEITDAGLAAVFDPTNSGLQMTLSHIALGKGVNDRSYTVQGTETALKGEFMRRAIGGGSRIASNEISVQALFDGAETGVIREIGVFTSTGKLFALWSGAAIGEKYADVPYIFAQTLVIDGINLDRVTWIAAAPNVNIIMAEPIAQLAIANLRHMRRTIESEELRVVPVIKSKFHIGLGDLA